MKQILFGLFTLLFFSSCEEFDFMQLKSRKQMHSDFVNENLQQFLIKDSTKENCFTSAQGVEICFGEESFMKEDSIFKGAVKIEFLEILSVPDMILSGMHTVYRSQKGELYLLNSGGEFNINAVDAASGEQLQGYRTYRLTIPAALTKNEGEEMDLFVAAPESDDLWVWQDSTLTDIARVNSTSSNAFELLYNKFVWLNCDDIIDFQQSEKSLITCLLPKDFDDTNCFVFMTLDDYPTSVARTNLPVPHNTSGKVILLARDDKDYYTSHKQFTSQKDLVVDLSDTKIEEIHPDEIRSHLEKLIN